MVRSRAAVPRGVAGVRAGLRPTKKVSARGGLVVPDRGNPWWPNGSQKGPILARDSPWLTDFGLLLPFCKPRSPFRSRHAASLESLLTQGFLLLSHISISGSKVGDLAATIERLAPTP